MLQLSHLKLLAGVVFALFILTACGGGGGDAAAPAAGGGGDSTASNDSGGGNTGGGAVTQATCEADGKYWTGTACVDKVASCDDANQHVVNNACTDYTQATCETASKHWNNTACVTDNYAAKDLDAFNTDEYKTSGTLLMANAKEGYVNIENLINADNKADSAIKQGGEGQIVSVVITTHRFNTAHQEFGTNGAAFNLVYNASSNTSYDTSAKIIDPNQGNCNHEAQCRGTQYASLIAGRRGGGDMHGIAYNAKLNAITSDNSQTQLKNALKKNVGVGANIIAMNHVWADSVETEACYDNGTASDVSDDKIYTRPWGLNVSTASGADGTDDCGASAISTANSAPLSATDLQPWKDAVSVDDIDDATNANDGNNTIMVFSAGGSSASFNSENGVVFSPTGNVNLDPIDIMGSVTAANIPAYHAAYPALYTESGTDFTSDRWLVVVGLNAAGTQILENSNGCGVAMHFCLAASGHTNAATADGRPSANAAYTTAGASTTGHASSTVAGALAVLKGAFPMASPEQLTALVLETSDYIALDNMERCDDVDDADTVNCSNDVLNDLKPLAGEETANRVQAKKRNGTDIANRYVNPVYGWGRLNLQAATSADVNISSLSVGNNESIGVLWKDTQLTLSSHFGTGLDSVSLGIGDEYGRHFTVKANKITSAPVAVASLDEYMANILADNVQSETLGGQAKLNYSNSGQPWMNLEYTSGKATSKIAFQDNYKINPLNDSGATSILRANHIRPASNNIGMMDIDYALNGALSLSSYAARGEYDTGYKFDELGTDFDVNYKKSHLNIAIGNIREHDQFLGTHTTGGYALNAPTVSRFTDVTYGHDVGNRFNIYANYINYETDVDMLYDQFASIDGLQADQYQVGFTGKSLISDDDNLNVALITKLGVTDGALNQNTTLGYTADGAFNDVSQSYDLAVSERHQQFEITYQGKIYQNADKVSTLKDNRFFTTIRVDQNLNHVQGASQTEVISGINARF